MQILILELRTVLVIESACFSMYFHFLALRIRKLGICDPLMYSTYPEYTGFLGREEAKLGVLGESGELNSS
jgi:hypothetical protein